MTPALLLQGLADIPKPIQLARYTATAYHAEDASTDPTPPTLIEGAHSLPTTCHKCAWVYTLLGCLAAGGKVEGSGEWGTLQCRYCPVLCGGSTHLTWGDNGVAFMAWHVTTEACACLCKCSSVMYATCMPDDGQKGAAVCLAGTLHY